MNNSNNLVYVNYFFLVKTINKTKAIPPRIKIHFITDSIPFNREEAALFAPKSIKIRATTIT